LESRGLTVSWCCLAVCGNDENDHLCMLCDSCDRAFHTYCVGLGNVVPEGNWFCADCDITGYFTASPTLVPVPRLPPQQHLHQTSRGMAISVTRRRPQTRASLNRRNSPSAAHRGARLSASTQYIRPPAPNISIADSSDSSSVRSDETSEDQSQAEVQQLGAASGAQEAIAEHRKCWADIQAGRRAFPPLAVHSQAHTSASRAISQCSDSNEQSLQGSATRRQLRPRERCHPSLINPSPSHSAATRAPTDAGQADVLAIASSILSCEELAPLANGRAASGSLRPWAPRRPLLQCAQAGIMTSP
jgi:hypothetical protein